MKKVTLTKLVLAGALVATLAACTSPAIDENALNNVDTSFTNATLNTADANAKIYNGYSQNELQQAYNTVYFGFDSYEPLPEYQAIIKAQAEFIIKANAKVLLQGFTDERGTPEYNITLGAERASAVAKLLVSYGVPASSIRQLSFGEERPAVLGHTEADYAKNRRVVFNYNF